MTGQQVHRWTTAAAYDSASVVVSGWVYDNDPTAPPASVLVQIDGQGADLTTDQARAMATALARAAHLADQASDTVAADPPDPADLDPIDLDALAHLVHRERERRGLSFRAAAEAAGTPLHTIQRVEDGHFPNLINFRRLVDWLGVPAEQFFTPAPAEPVPDRIATLLATDPALEPKAAANIAGLVREMYKHLARAALTGQTTKDGA